MDNTITITRKYTLIPTFSDTKDKYGNYIVTSHTPHSIINGNAYILADSDNIFISIALHFMHNGILIALQFILLIFS